MRTQDSYTAKYWYSTRGGVPDQTPIRDVRRNLASCTFAPYFISRKRKFLQKSEETFLRTNSLQDKMEQLTVQDAAIPLRFCPNSNDLLYPKEDKVNKKLIYFCRNCEYTTPAVDFCVHRRRIFHSASEITAIIHDVRTDPTLPRSKDVRCVVCEHGEAVFFSQTTAEGMSLFFQCVGCGHKWKDTGLAT